MNTNNRKGAFDSNNEFLCFYSRNMFIYSLHWLYLFVDSRTYCTDPTGLGVVWTLWARNSASDVSDLFSLQYKKENLSWLLSAIEKIDQCIWLGDPRFLSETRHHVLIGSWPTFSYQPFLHPSPFWPLQESMIRLLCNFTEIKWQKKLTWDEKELLFHD